MRALLSKACPAAAELPARKTGSEREREQTHFRREGDENHTGKSEEEGQRGRWGQQEEDEVRGTNTDWCQSRDQGAVREGKTDWWNKIQSNEKHNTIWTISTKWRNS